MKKTIVSVMTLSLIGLGAMQANAQTSFGIKADANLSNFVLKDMPGVKSNMGVGASLGGFAKFDFGEFFAIQPELLFHYQSSETKSGGVARDFEYWGVEIPIYAMAQCQVGNNSRFYAGVGPYVGVGFDARYKEPTYKLYKEDYLQPWDFGVGAQVGYEFGNGIQINAGYKIGMINAINDDANLGDAKMLPQRVSLGVGFRF